METISKIRKNLTLQKNFLYYIYEIWLLKNKAKLKIIKNKIKINKNKRR